MHANKQDKVIGRGVHIHVYIIGIAKVYVIQQTGLSI